MEFKRDAAGSFPSVAATHRQRFFFINISFCDTEGFSFLLSNYYFLRAIFIAPKTRKIMNMVV